MPARCGVSCSPILRRSGTKFDSRVVLAMIGSLVVSATRDFQRRRVSSASDELAILDSKHVPQAIRIVTGSSYMGDTYDREVELEVYDAREPRN